MSSPPFSLRAKFGTVIVAGVIALYLILLLVMPYDGFWTLDNGLKYLIIKDQVSHPFRSFDIPISHPEIDPWNEATPLTPPFVHREDHKIIPVFPPLFVVLCSLTWKLAGQWTPSVIPWLAAIGVILICWRVFLPPYASRGENKGGLSSDLTPESGIPPYDSSRGEEKGGHSSATALILVALASPLAFYALTLWEHTLAMLCVTAGVALSFETIQPDVGLRKANPTYKSSVMRRQFFAGLLLGIGGMFRLECWIVAVSWVIVSIPLSRKNSSSPGESGNSRLRWTALIFGLLTAALLWLATNFWWTGSFLPLQFSENWKMYGSPSEPTGFLGWIIARWDSLTILLFSANPRLTTNLLLNAAMILGIALAVVPLKRRITSASGFRGNDAWMIIGLGLILGSYLMFLILEWHLDHPIAATAFTGGLLWTCPWAIFAIPQMRQQAEIRKLSVAILMSIVLVIAITPISKGIHFGPRILLGVIPLLAIAVSQTASPVGRRGYFQIAAWLLVGLTVVHQARGVSLLERQESLNAVLASRVSALEERIILTDLWWFPADVARAWDEHSFFLVSRPEVLEDVLFHMKTNGVTHFAFCSESPASIAKLDAPITVGKRLTWESAERPPAVVEHVRLIEDSSKWAALATRVGLRRYSPESLYRALIPFQSAVSWSPRDPDAWYRLGVLKLELGDEEGARQALETVVSIDSTHQRSLKALRHWRNVREQ